MTLYLHLYIHVLQASVQLSTRSGHLESTELCNKLCIRCVTPTLKHAKFQVLYEKKIIRKWYGCSKIKGTELKEGVRKLEGTKIKGTKIKGNKVYAVSIGIFTHPTEPTFIHIMDTHTSMSYHRSSMACDHKFVAYLSCKSVVVNPSSIVEIQWKVVRARLYWNFV